jgi:5'-nucleotidase
MKILITNDDGIKAEGLWALAAALKYIADITVVAPDSERSAIGTAVTLFAPLRVKQVEAPLAGVTALAVDGSPSDCVILALGKLIGDKVDMVVSGINPNLNLGEDVYISGTVGAAMQGYFRGLPALAVSAPPDSRYGLDTGARVAAILARKMADSGPARIFLNVNVPDLPVKDIKGVKITRLARSSHINTVEEENHGRLKQYRLVRERIPAAGSEGTDIEAIVGGYVSITPLYTSLLDKPPQRLLKKLCHELEQEIKKESAV